MAKLFPYRVVYMANNPMSEEETPELLYAGDVRLLDPRLIDPQQLADGVFVRVPEGTPLNTAPRPEMSRIRGYNTPPDQWDKIVELMDRASDERGQQVGLRPDA